jgi:hypothetical protein
MKKLFFLLLLIAGVGVWFYLLLGKEENPADQKATSEVTKDESQKEPSEKNTRATTSPDAPPNTDAGMEFPTI